MDGEAVVKLYCNQADINVQKELDNLNKLYNQLNILHYGFDHFFVIEIISVNENYHSTYHFVSNRLWEKKGNIQSKARENFFIFQQYCELPENEIARVFVCCPKCLLPSYPNKTAQSLFSLSPFSQSFMPYFVVCFIRKGTPEDINYCK